MTLGYNGLEKQIPRELRTSKTRLKEREGVTLQKEKSRKRIMQMKAQKSRACE